MLLAKDFNVLVRDNWIPWQAIFSVTSQFDFYWPVDKDNWVVWWHPILVKARVGQRGEWRGLDFNTFDSLSILNCQDPRDKFYGLMSLVPSLLDRIVVDYNKTTYEVFSDVVILAMATTLASTD